MKLSKKIVYEFEKADSELSIKKKLTVWCTCWGVLLIALLLWLVYAFYR